MKQDATITIAFIFSLISTLGVIINIILTIKRDSKNQQKDHEKTNEDIIKANSLLNEGIIKANMKLDQVCTTTLDINKQLDKLNDRVNEMALKQENHETRLRMLEEK